jgi:hypothetical protein
MYRTYSMTQYSESPYLYLGWKKNIEAVIDSRKSLPPNNNVSFGIPYFTDRGWLEGGLGISRRSNLENFLLQQEKEQFITAKILGMYSVKYITVFPILLTLKSINDIELGKTALQN